MTRRKFEWYQRNHRAELRQCIRLPLEARGAYLTLLNLILDEEDELPDDDEHLARTMNIGIRVWKRLKSFLVEADKIRIENGYVRMVYASELVSETRTKYEIKVERARKNGQNSGAARRKNNDLHEQKENEIIDREQDLEKQTYLESYRKETQTEESTPLYGSLGPGRKVS